MGIDIGWLSTSRTVVLAVFLGVIVVGEPASAEGVAPAFACDVRAILSLPSGAKLVTLQPTADQQRRLAAAKPWHFGPFDRTVYGFEWVLFYLDVPDSSEEWKRQEVDLLLRLEGPRSPWFRLVGSELVTTLPQLVVRHGRAEEGNVVRFATPDPRLPLFFVEVDTFDTRSNVTQRYLIDMRPRRPRVPALLECVEMLAWGACGTWDANYGGVRGTLACAWQADRGDFGCRETLGIDTPWGGRSAVRDFLLLSPPEPDKLVEARVSSGLSELVAATATTPSARREVDGLGPVHAVATLDRAGEGSLVLLAAAGASSSFSARFFLGVVAPDGSVQVSQVDEPRLSPSFWTLGELDGGPVVVPGTPQPGELLFRAVTLVSPERGPTIPRVRVREAAPSAEPPQESPEAVYWIGIQDRGTEVIASALRLATNTAEYTPCAGARTAPNAVGVRVLAERPFTAELDVEPPHGANLFAEGLQLVDATDSSDSPPPECPVKVRVTWNAGFEVSEPEGPSPCPAGQPRLVRIDEDGEIHAIAGPKAQNEEPPP